MRAHGVLLAVQVGQALQHLRCDRRQHILRDAPLLRTCASAYLSDIPITVDYACGLLSDMHAD